MPYFGFVCVCVRAHSAGGVILHRPLIRLVRAVKSWEVWMLPHRPLGQRLLRQRASEFGVCVCVCVCVCVLTGR